MFPLSAFMTDSDLLGSPDDLKSPTVVQVDGQPVTIGNCAYDALRVIAPPACALSPSL